MPRASAAAANRPHLVEFNIVVVGANRSDLALFVDVLGAREERAATVDGLPIPRHTDEHRVGQRAPPDTEEDESPHAFEEGESLEVRRKNGPAVAAPQTLSAPWVLHSIEVSQLTSRLKHIVRDIGIDAFIYLDSSVDKGDFFPLQMAIEHLREWACFYRGPPEWPLAYFNIGASKGSLGSNPYFVTATVDIDSIHGDELPSIFEVSSRLNTPAAISPAIHPLFLLRAHHDDCVGTRLYCRAPAFRH
jgi:hypothetical protein